MNSSTLHLQLDFALQYNSCNSSWFCFVSDFVIQKKKKKLLLYFLFAFCIKKKGVSKMQDFNKVLINHYIYLSLG